MFQLINASYNGIVFFSILASVPVTQSKVADFTKTIEAPI